MDKPICNINDKMYCIKCDECKMLEIIGHTRTGKPIYSNFYDIGHRRFSPSEHYDACNAHEYHIRQIRTNNPKYEKHVKYGIKHLESAKNSKEATCDTVEQREIKILETQIKRLEDKEMGLKTLRQLWEENNRQPITALSGNGSKLYIIGVDEKSAFGRRNDCGKLQVFQPDRLHYVKWFKPKPVPHYQAIYIRNSAKDIYIRSQTLYTNERTARKNISKSGRTFIRLEKENPVVLQPLNNGYDAEFDDNGYESHI